MLNANSVLAGGPQVLMIGQIVRDGLICASDESPIDGDPDTREVMLFPTEWTLSSHFRFRFIRVPWKSGLSHA